MILANITSYVGLDSQAEHYYCHYVITDLSEPKPHYTSTESSSIELKHKLTESESIRLTKKDEGYRWTVGTKTNRFESINKIHKDLLKLFPNETIITYYENKLFKEMLYVKDDVNLGYKAFGEVWSYCPTGCWTDLLTEEKNIIKIKCDDCGKEYTLDEVSYEKNDFDNYDNGEIRKYTQFYRRKDFESETGEDLCCKYFNLMWNVVL